MSPRQLRPRAVAKVPVMARTDACPETPFVSRIWRVPGSPVRHDPSVKDPRVDYDGELAETYAEGRDLTAEADRDVAAGD